MLIHPYYTGERSFRGAREAGMGQRQNYSTVILFIGLAALFVSGEWFPGLLLVLAFMATARDYQRRRRHLSSSSIILFGLWAAFWIAGGNLFLPIILVMLGLSQLPHFKRQRKREKEKAKAKAIAESESTAPSLDQLIAESAADGEYDQLDELFTEEDGARR